MITSLFIAVLSRASSFYVRGEVSDPGSQDAMRDFMFHGGFVRKGAWDLKNLKVQT